MFLLYDLGLKEADEHTGLLAAKRYMERRLRKSL